MRAYNVTFRKRVIKEMDVRIEADTATAAVIRAARDLPDEDWEYVRVEVTADDGGVDEVVV